MLFVGRGGKGGAKSFGGAAAGGDGGGGMATLVCDDP